MYLSDFCKNVLCMLCLCDPIRRHFYFARATQVLHLSVNPLCDVNCLCKRCIVFHIMSTPLVNHTAANLYQPLTFKTTKSAPISSATISFEIGQDKTLQVQLLTQKKVVRRQTPSPAQLILKLGNSTLMLASQETLSR